MKTVFVGLSGGVDSSVAALLLGQAGYDVVGVYMKNWSKDLPGFACPWKDDYLDAKRVAVQLGIEFELFDFENQYEEKVVRYMIDAFAVGLTPNPDIMCNQEIKFRLFYDTAKERGADIIATGHYAQTRNGELYAGTDANKDQSYFLYRATSKTLRDTLFPLGSMYKSEIRAIAAKHNLVTAHKKESMGICFVGKVGIKEFLMNYVSSEPGPIIDQYGQEIGQHDGAIFYTIGQRHGLGVGGGLPVYVTGKDMTTNTVYVTSQIDDAKLWKNFITYTSPHWITDKPEASNHYEVRSRYREKLVSATVDTEKRVITLDDPVRAVSPGQSVVIYENNKVVGGAIVA